MSYAGNASIRRESAALNGTRSNRRVRKIGWRFMGRAGERRVRVLDDDMLEKVVKV